MKKYFIFGLAVYATLSTASVRAQTAPASAVSATPILPTQPEAPKVDLKFSFGPQPLTGFTQVKPDDTYTPEKGYGFDLGTNASVVNRGGNDPQKAGFVTGDKGRPLFFSVKLAPGAYQVKVTLGDPAGESTTTVKSETRRLMREAAHTASGQLQTHTFLVHVRVPQIPGGGVVALKPRERDPILYLSWDAADEINTRRTFLELDWDEKLTLEFSDAKVALDAIEITNADKPITVYLVGDSTMTDQMMEPWGTWGMMFPRWFKAPVLIANYAESGESAASFIGERRWPKLLSEVHPGDYIFIQFGINDRATPLDRFKQYCEQFVAEARAHGAIPVLVTSQNLRAALDANGQPIQTLGAYPTAMWEVATEQKTWFIDLNTISGKLYAAIGREKLPKAFVDGTHQNIYGGYELAKCVVQAIIDNKLPLAQYVVDDWKTFDPAHPDALEDFKLPPDPQLDPARPGGPGVPPGAASATQPGSPTPARGAAAPATTTSTP
jgi:lysophospholipase L1-like esterase